MYYTLYFLFCQYLLPTLFCINYLFHILYTVTLLFLRPGLFLYRRSRLGHAYMCNKWWKSNKFSHIRHDKSVYFSIKVLILKIWGVSCFHISARAGHGRAVKGSMLGGGQALCRPAVMSPRHALYAVLCALCCRPGLFPCCRVL